MAIDIRGLGNRDALAQIARLAYGSGRSENTSGGKGNIGILNGRVVKFNTHYGERRGKVTDDMRTSCNELRTKLSEIATAMLAAKPDAAPEAKARLDRTLASVRRELGMNAEGSEVATQKLLDRKAVATVLNAIRDTTGFDVWGELRNGDAPSLSSKNVDTHFNLVAYRLHVADTVAHWVNRAADEIAHPADGKPGVALNEKARKFLVELVQRDVAARCAAGGEAIDVEEIARDIGNFSSPYLIVTLQTFNLSSAVLSHAYDDVRRTDSTAATLVGSPRNQRADRADVALTFLRNRVDRSFVSFALALVAEKMPEMRRLQPFGRLTAATVWRACFGESVPKAAAQITSQAFADAFIARMDRLTVALTAKHGPGAIKGKGLTMGQLLAKYPLVGAGLFNGSNFTAAVCRGVGAPKFVPDVNRDYVAALPLYAAQDALVKTEEDLESMLVTDFTRNYPVITLECGMVDETADFRPFEDQNLSPQENLQNARAFIGQVDRVFGERITPVQRKLLLIGLTQVGYLPFTALLGVGGEHTQAAATVHCEEDGSITLSYESLPDNPIEARYSYRIEPDGTNYRVGEFVSRIRKQA